MEKTRLQVRLSDDRKQAMERIQKVLLEKGIAASLVECDSLWEAVSNEYCAGDLILPSTDRELWENIKTVLDEFDDSQDARYGTRCFYVVKGE